MFSKNKSIFWADGRITVSGQNKGSNKKKLIKFPRVLIGAAGVIDNNHSDKSFDIIKGLEQMKFDNSKEPYAIRETIFNTIEKEFNKGYEVKFKRVLLLVSYKKGKDCINETLEYYHDLKKSILRIKPRIVYYPSVTDIIEKNISLNLFDKEFIEEFKSKNNPLNTITIDTNHNYIDEYNSGNKMSDELIRILPTLLVSSIHEEIGKFPTANYINGITLAEADKIGIRFFQKFNKLNQSNKIGDFEMSGII